MEFKESEISYVARINSEVSNIIHNSARLKFANDRYTKRGIIQEFRRSLEKLNLYVGYIEESNERSESSSSPTVSQESSEGFAIPQSSK